MSDWIDAATAYDHVLSIELNPETARKRLLIEIAEERLPTKGAEGFLPPDLVKEYLRDPDLNQIGIDFAKGTVGVTLHRAGWYDGLLYSEMDITNLQFSRKHLTAKWPGLTPPRQTIPDGARSRGKRPEQLERVKAEMRKFDRKSLDGMVEVAMEAQFGASRDTCRKARAAIQSE